jgi:hypothetical protein
VLPSLPEELKLITCKDNTDGAYEVAINITVTQSVSSNKVVEESISMEAMFLFVVRFFILFYLILTVRFTTFLLHICFYFSVRLVVCIFMSPYRVPFFFFPRGPRCVRAPFSGCVPALRYVKLPTRDCEETT